MIILNDIHIGVERQAGTTPDSAHNLRMWALKQFAELMEQARALGDDICILGDLFDRKNVALEDLYMTWEIIHECMEESSNRLYLVAGNHDLHTDSSQFSSFDMLCKLVEHTSRRVHVVRGAGQAMSLSGRQGFYVIPHVPTQEMFAAEFAKVPECDWLLVHANYNNFFARQSDGSLNVSEEMAMGCKATRIFFAHEHDHRVELGGKVFIGGNQFPTSVNDCLRKEDKAFHKLDGLDVTRHISWQASNYREMKWNDPYPTKDYQFIRVKGEAHPDEALQAQNAYTYMREHYKSFVVGNAIKYATDADTGNLDLSSIENLEKFDIMKVLKKYMPEDEMAILENLQ